MTWSFDPTLPSLRDKVRLHIGDTDTNDPQLTNETLDVLCARYPNEFRCAQQACEALVAKYSREVDRNVGQTTIHEGDRSMHYRQLAWVYRWRR